MDNNIKIIQDKLINNLERLDTETDDLSREISRSNAISQLASTYIKSCNLVIRVEESRFNLRNKVSEVVNNEK